MAKQQSITNKTTQSAGNLLPAATVTPKQFILTVLRTLKYNDLKEKHPTVPDEELQSLAKSATFKDGKANDLTSTIVKVIELLGGFASRQQSTGLYRGGRYTHSTTKRGVSDVTGVLNSKSLNIEVKIGKDRQSPAQKKVQAQILAAGGLYYVSKDLPNTWDYIIATCEISQDWITKVHKEGTELFKRK